MYGDDAPTRCAASRLQALEDDDAMSGMIFAETPALKDVLAQVADVEQCCMSVFACRLHLAQPLMHTPAPQ